MFNHTVEEFAKSFDIEVEELPEEAISIINNCDFSYRILQGEEFENAVLDQLKRIEEDSQVIAAPERTDQWEKGWNENLVEFKKGNYDVNLLMPKFFRKDIPLRLNQKFIKSENERFEYDFYRVFKAWIFKQYFSEYDNIYEFGCGTGYNLVELSRIYPDKKIMGLDFVPSVVELLDEINTHGYPNIKGKLFNMIEPDFNMEIPEGTAFYTFGAIEQLGSRIENIIKFFLTKKPGIIVHMEPTIELYDENNLIDYLSIKFHKKRGYTEGLLPVIESLEKERKAEIIKVRRMYFGNYNMEGYTVIIWRPISG